MDQLTAQTIAEIEARSRFPTGRGRIARGECPKGAVNPVVCMFCYEGHMLECHYPQTCEEARCSHYHAEQETE